MVKSLMVAAIGLLVSVAAQAQDTYPRVEVFGGYSYFSADVEFDNPFDDDDDDFFDQREGLHGVGFSVAGNFHPNVGIVGDFSYHKREIEVPFGDDIDFSTFSFLFGPRFTARGDRVEGFAHALFGGVRRKAEFFDGDTDFAMGFGVGMDIKATESFAVRLFQVDYIPVRTRNPFTLDREWEDNVRFQIGLTYRWGGQ